MEMKSQAKIISYNIYNENICASAARISTTQGNAYEIFERAKDNPKNQDLIKKVLQSGHKSIIEHAVFTIALWNVSAFVEQFFIECRLASFTIKSRRYVDFSNLGYYIPSDLYGDDLSHYCHYMDLLFDAYQMMLEQGIPKEDARFLLPYSFNSNFYCTINARELSHIICAIRYGRGREIPELQNLANQIVKQIETLFPGLVSEFDSTSNQYNGKEALFRPDNTQDTIAFIESQEIGVPRLINSPQNPLKILNVAYHINHPDLIQPFDVNLLLKSGRPRELEQLSYSFLISNITLSGTTHIVRHRMQSIIIPPIQSVNHSKYIIPTTIKSNPTLLKQYKHILTKANDMVKHLKDSELLKNYSYYYALSGNLIDIMTTMNARELMLFVQLRACSRAQWEIRDITIKMLKQLRDHFPELFNNLGPGCYIKGYCPERNMTCGKMNKNISRFSNQTL